MSEKSKFVDRRPRIDVTIDMMERYIELIQETGLEAECAGLVGCRPNDIKNARRRDPGFDEACREALAIHTDTLIREAIHRATEGDDEPVIGGRFKDEVVCKIKRKSDRLMELLLASRDDRFRKQSKQEINVSVGVKAGVIILPGTTPSADVWEKQMSMASKGLTNHPDAERLTKQAAELIEHADIVEQPEKVQDNTKK